MSAMSFRANGRGFCVYCTGFSPRCPVSIRGKNVPVRGFWPKKASQTSAGRSRRNKIQSVISGDRRGGNDTSHAGGADNFPGNRGPSGMLFSKKAALPGKGEPLWGAGVSPPPPAPPATGAAGSGFAARRRPRRPGRSPWPGPGHAPCPGAGGPRTPPG